MAGTEGHIIMQQVNAAAMEEDAVAIARRKIAGGRNAPFFRKPYLDAAFNGSLFLWDTCMIAAWAKYYTRELPVIPALDNFYRVQDADGFLCREYLPDGTAAWDKGHPIAVAPPILAWAELELHSRTADLQRLRKVYPALVRLHRYMERTYREDDGLYFSDAHGSGMDNIPRAPRGWKPDGNGIALDIERCHPSVREFARVTAKDAELGNCLAWNRQGRAVDLSAQMALDAGHLARIASLLGRPAEESSWQRERDAINETINRRCWSATAAFYLDLGYGKPIERRHVGMFWTLWSGAAAERTQRQALVRALQDPARFNRPVPVPSLAADEPEYKPWGQYWRGGVWAPTTYMVLRGLRACGEERAAARIARRLYNAVACVWRHTGTFWENYAPETLSYGQPARPDFCGWTALVPVSIRREFHTDERNGVL